MKKQQEAAGASAKAPAGGLRDLSSAALGVPADSARHAEQDFAVWVRALMQNWRQGTVGCKGRSDVARTNKKPWKQKGTGRARAGSARSPLWRGGGVIFGPQKRTRSLTINRKQRRNALMAILEGVLADGRAKLLNWSVPGDQPKSSAAATALKEAGLAGKKVTLFVRPDDELTFRSFRNIAGINVLSFDQPNAVHLVSSEYWLVLDKDQEQFKAMVAQWS